MLDFLSVPKLSVANIEEFRESNERSMFWIRKLNMMKDPHVTGMGSFVKEK
jgi:hypothetical protein